MYHVGHAHVLHGDRSIERDDAQPGRDPRRWLALCVLCLAALICAIDMTVTNVALPFLAVDLKANTDDLQWIIDSYTVVIAGLLLLGGGLADRYGRKPVFLTGFAVFGCSSFAAAFSSSPAQLIGLRALMGVGAAMLFTPALAILSVLFDESERPKAIALWTVFGAAGLAIGPVMGGILLDHFRWGSVFLINLPVTIVGIVLGVMFTPNSRKPGAPHLDIIGGLLSVGALGVLLFGIIQGPTTGWSAPSTVLAVAGGLALGCAFVVWELRADAPMFNVRILRRRTASTGAVSLFLVYLTLSGVLFLVPQYLQFVRARSVLETGVSLVPLAVTFSVLTSLSPKILERLGARTTLSLGLLITALGLLVIAVLRVEGGWLDVVLGTMVAAAGWAFVLAPATTVVMSGLRVEEANDGSAVNMVSRFVGGAFGVAIVGSVFATVYARDLGRSVAPLPALKAADAKRSISAALADAKHLDPAARRLLMTTARHAFVDGARAGLTAAIVLTVIGAVVALVSLPRRAPVATGVLAPASTGA